MVIPDTSFLLLNKSFILSFLTLFVPVFWVTLALSDFITFKVYDNKLGSFIFWVIAPVFLLSIFSYIKINSIVPIVFINDILSTMSSISNIVVYIKDHSYLSLYILSFLVTFRIVFWVFISFVIYIINEIKKWSKKD
jgi:hypothetical protein